MLPEQQQRIMGYFIEEAKDHLNTIEQGLLNLQATIADPEMANEVFRAAHSVKGGAAMLGIESMQRASHRLEDYFKILKESPVRVDRALETMCLQVFDALQELLEQLQGPFGLTEDKAQEIMTNVEPVFGQLDEHLNSLVQQSAIAPESPAAAPAARRPPAAATSHAEQSALDLVFKSDVPSSLRDMLKLFKQQDSSATRYQLQEVCNSLSRIGEQFDLVNWCDLVKSAQAAIANEDNTYRDLAPVVIKDLKQGQDLVLSGRAAEVSVSDGLQQMLPDDVLSLDESAALEDLLSDDDVSESGDDLGDLFGAAADPADELNFEESLASSAADEPPQHELADSSNTPSDLPTPEILLEPIEAPPVRSALHNGPEMGMAELNSLADLFEGDANRLDTSWQEEVADEISAGEADALDVNIADDDFSDLLAETPADNQAEDLAVTDDLGDLFGDEPEQLTSDEAEPRETISDSAESDVSDLLGMFDDEAEAADSDPAESTLTPDLTPGSAPPTRSSVPPTGGLDELDDFFNEFEGDDAVGLTPAPAAAATAADFDADFDQTFAIESSDETGANESAEPADEVDLLESAEIIENAVVSEADASIVADDLSSDLWADDDASTGLDSDSSEASSFDLEPISDPWEGSNEPETSLDLAFEMPEVAAESDDEALDSLFAENSVSEESSSEAEGLELEQDWSLTDESDVLAGDADEAADLDFDLEANLADTSAPTATAATSADLDFDDLLSESESSSADLDELGATFDSDDSGFDNLAAPSEADDELDFSDIGDGSDAEEFTLDFGESEEAASQEPVTSATDELIFDLGVADDSAEAESAEGPDDLDFTVEALEVSDEAVADSELEDLSAFDAETEDFSSMFDDEVEDADSTEIQVADTDESLSGLFEETESTDELDLAA
ncbi:MAG: hypothetical protein F6K04_14490, partial [Leptolyngbya sp. SIO4C5]|nr:hypothetical protein [Leptolyngbya sp. SIO4C5]